VRILALTSGGLDSLCMLHWLKTGSHAWSPDEVKAVHWSYGQGAFREALLAPRTIADWTNPSIDCLKLHGNSRFKKGLIPFRNLFLVSATGMAEQNEDIIISIGIHSGTGYYDCSPAFVDECDRILENHTRGRARLIAPFLHWTKADIFSYVYSQKLPADLTYSCETGGIPPCGSCSSCKDRER